MELNQIGDQRPIGRANMGFVSAPDSLIYMFGGESSGMQF